MRIIRFLDNDGLTHVGIHHDDATATVLMDPQGVLGPLASPHREILRGRHALVADDDENMRLMMATVLRKVGCICTLAADGAAAVHALNNESIDLVVSDIVMPHHDGYAIFAAAKRKAPAMPVVLVTGFGYDPTHSLVRASEEGLTSVLYKPFTPQQLLDEIAQAIRVETPNPAAALVATSDRLPVSRLLAPLEPTNIICVENNHAEDGDREHLPQLQISMKPTTTVQAPGEPIIIPDLGAVDPMLICEGELAVVIGFTAQNVDVAAALDHVLGYTCGTDVAAKHFDAHPEEPGLMHGKGFDTFCPLGPGITTTDEVADPDALHVRTAVNDQVIAQGCFAHTPRTVAMVVSELSHYMTLHPGTVILVGNPARIDPNEAPHLRGGDEVAVEIDTIGRLISPVQTS